MAAIFFNLKYLLLIVGAYLLGSVTWGMVLTRIFTQKDLRKKGSGNIGATNVARVAGNTLGLLTLALDVAKGAFPVYLAGIIVQESGMEKEIIEALVTFASISGHLFPIFLKFKGGKGVATAAGCFLVLSPMSLLMALTGFILVIIFTNRVSAGSISAAIILPAAVFITTKSWIFTGCALVTSILVIIAHKDNVKRLINGTEPKFRTGK